MVAPSRRSTFPFSGPTRRSSGVCILVHHRSARDFLIAAGLHLQDDQRGANILLRDAIDLQKAEGHGSSTHTLAESNAWWDEHLKAESPGEESDKGSASFITVWTVDECGRTLDIALSCVGEKPVFLFCPKRMIDLSAKFLDTRVTLLAERMLSVIPSRRVFSMFGPRALVMRLAEEWSRVSGHGMLQPAFYHAFYTFCTAGTLEPPVELPEGHRMTVGGQEHIAQAAILAKEFADDSVYFPLDIEHATEEVTHLIRMARLYVYEIWDQETSSFEVVSIVAVTRESEQVAAISKVFTHTSFRSKGFARRLVAWVSAQVLQSKKLVVLYVAHDNPAAATVYGRVGFVGVGERPTHPNVEDWMELGFQNTNRGHW